MTVANPIRAYGACILMVGSSFLTSIGDALVKAVTDDVSLGQLYVMRSVVAVPVLILIIGIIYRGVLRVGRPRWLVVRSLLMLAMWMFFYSALASVGLAVAAAGLYTFPLFLVIANLAFGVERVSVASTTALLIGFAGVLLVLQPTGPGFTPALLLPLGAAVCYAAQAMVTRHQCHNESAWALSLGMNIAFPVMGGLVLTLGGVLQLGQGASDTLVFLLGGWQATSTMVWAIILALGLIIVAASASMAAAYQRGHSAIIAAFDYSHLVFATLWGTWFFDEAIGWMEASGIAAISVAGIIVLRTEESIA